MKPFLATLALLASLILLGSPLRSASPSTDAPATAPAKPAPPKPYPFDTSVVSGAKLPAHPLVFVDAGYEIKVATATEQVAFQKTPAPFLVKIKQAYATAKPYPLGTCLVCGMPTADDDITFVYLGQQYKVCGGDEDCFAVFQKDPAAYVKKLAAATAHPSPPK